LFALFALFACALTFALMVYLHPHTRVFPSAQSCCFHFLAKPLGANVNICSIHLHTCTHTHTLARTQVEEDPTGGKLSSSSGRLNGAPHKLHPIINFHVGDTVTSLQRAALQPGGQEVGGCGPVYVHCTAYSHLALSALQHVYTRCTVNCGGARVGWASLYISSCVLRRAVSGLAGHHVLDGKFSLYVQQCV